MKHFWRLAVFLTVLAQFSAACAGEDRAVVSDKARPNILLVTGQDLHKWKQTTPVVVEMLQKDPRLRVRVVERPAFLADPSIHQYDAIVMHWMDWKVAAPGPQARENFKKYIADGGGAFLIHFACGAWQDWPEFRKIVGRVWDPKLRGHDPRGPFRVNITEAKHPITKGLDGFDTDDELYTCLTGEAPVEVLATARSKVDGKDHPMALTYRFGKGRVFQCLLGHDVKSLRKPGVDELFRRGCAWSAGLSPLPGKQQPPDQAGINKKFLDPKLNAQDWVERFEGEKREVAANREAVVKALKLEAGKSVADVGSGTGLFLEPFSAAVADKGRVFALEISPGFVKHLKKRVEQKELKNVTVLLSKEKSTGLADASVDVVFVCDTYHHFEYHVEMLRSIHNALRSGGQFVVIDFERIPGKTPKWLLDHMRAGKEEFKQEIEQAGFRFTEEVKIPNFRQNYFLRFEKE